MADMTDSKLMFANQMQQVVAPLLKIAQQLDKLNASFSVHGFQTGGANAFADGDFTINNQHLTAQIVNDVMFAIGTIVTDLSTGVRNSLRECLPGANV